MPNEPGVCSVELPGIVTRAGRVVARVDAVLISPPPRQCQLGEFPGGDQLRIAALIHRQEHRHGHVDLERVPWSRLMPVAARQGDSRQAGQCRRHRRDRLLIGGPQCLNWCRSPRPHSQMQHASVKAGDQKRIGRRVGRDVILDPRTTIAARRPPRSSGRRSCRTTDCSAVVRPVGCPECWSRRSPAPVGRSTRRSRGRIAGGCRSAGSPPSCCAENVLGKSKNMPCMSIIQRPSVISRMRGHSVYQP